MSAGKLARLERAFDHKAHLLGIERLAQELIDRRRRQRLPGERGWHVEDEDADDVGMGDAQGGEKAEALAAEIEPALARGVWVVSDRYVPSSLVYQGVVRELGVEVVEQLSAVATAGLAPDVVVLLDVSDAVAEKRRAHARRTDDGDRLEREGSAFHASVRAAYRDLAPERGWIVVDADGEVEEVAELVVDAVAPLLAG